MEGVRVPLMRSMAMLRKKVVILTENIMLFEVGLYVAFA